MHPVSVGLVGAGPWASMVYGPLLAGRSDLELSGVWARRPEAAEALASRSGTIARSSYEELLDTCEAVVFAVPPDGQATMAAEAARAGKAVLLEKPIAGDLEGAERLADAIGEAGVGSQITLTWRYAATVRSFLESAHAAELDGGRGAFVSGALLGGPFTTPWRLERGPLLDLGPHLIDLLDAALGTVVGVQAHGDLHGWIGLLLDHEGGAASEASLCATAAVEPHVAEVKLYGRGGAITVDCATAVTPDAFVTLASEFVETVRAGGGHPLDVQRGLHLQRIITDAESQLLGP